MKRIILIFSLFCLTLAVSPQEPFNLRIVNNYGTISNNLFLLEDSGYVCMGRTQQNGTQHYFVSQFDTEGALIQQKNYGFGGEWRSYSAFQNACIKTIDGNYAFPGHAKIGPFGFVDTSFVYLTLFNENLDSLWTKCYLQDTIPLEVRGMCQTQDKGLMMVGETHRKANGSLTHFGSCDAFVLKLDSLGNQQWYKTYGKDFNEDSDDWFQNVLQTPEGDYLCGGYTKSQQTGNYFDNKGEWWLVRLNNQGNVIWERKYGNPELNDGFPQALFMASDTSYYMIGAKAKASDGNILYQSHILKLNKYFHRIYEKDFGKPRMINWFASITENQEHDLIVSGVYQPGNGFEPYSQRGFLLKLSASGDSIWQRQYVSTDTLDWANYNTPYSVKQTPDGGYIFTGLSYDYDSYPQQQIWLVKTDEYGCDGTDWWDCATNVGLSPAVSEIGTLEVYPNPVKDELVVEFVMFNGQKVNQLGIYDLKGRLMQSQKVHNTYGMLKIDVSHLAEGTYIVTFGTNGVHKNAKKFIVKR